MAEQDPPSLSRENAALRRAVAELTVLNEIAREIGALSDLDAVLRAIVERSIAAVSADQGVITLVGEAGTPDAVHTLIRSRAEATAEPAVHVDAHLVELVRQRGAPLRLNVPGGALALAPLLARGRLVGVLAAHCRTGAFSDEDERLLGIIAGQSAQVIENARLYEEERALLQVREELRVASEIQTRLLPAAPPALPGYDVAGRTLPARRVGGDFFDYIALGERRTAFCVGDVSGKGLPAALLMASAQAALRGQADAARSPAETVARTNWQVYRSIRRGSFLTLFYAELDPETHRLRYVNAGHNRPLLLRPSGAIEELREGGVALGLVPRAEYAEGEVTLGAGDLLLLFSDGVTEAADAGGRPFEEAQLAEALRTLAGRPAQEVLDGLLARVRAHTGDDDAHADDVTLLVIARQT